MFKIFRKIRFDLLDNKAGRYLKYAIGEIILVVIGILIALQINTMNEQHKKDILRQNYIASMVKDLRADQELLEDLIKNFETELSTLSTLSTRLSSDRATRDTLIQIARYEFLPYFDPSNNLNLNTYSAIISTGNLDLFSPAMVQRIQIHNSRQQNILDVTELNYRVFTDIAKDYIQSYPLNYSLNAINGKQMDSFWSEVETNKLKVDLNGVLSFKITAFDFVTDGRKQLLRDTKKLIEDLENGSI